MANLSGWCSRLTYCMLAGLALAYTLCLMKYQEEIRAYREGGCHAAEPKCEADRLEQEESVVVCMKYLDTPNLDPTSLEWRLSTFRQSMLVIPWTDNQTAIQFVANEGVRSLFSSRSSWTHLCASGKDIIQPPSPPPRFLLTRSAYHFWNLTSIEGSPDHAPLLHSLVYHQDLSLVVLALLLFGIQAVADLKQFYSEERVRIQNIRSLNSEEGTSLYNKKDD